MAKKKPNQKMQVWIDARKRHRLSHALVQMARELRDLALDMHMHVDLILSYENNH
jgi:hypothetical protein